MKNFNQLNIKCISLWRCLKRTATNFDTIKPSIAVIFIVLFKPYAFVSRHIIFLPFFVCDILPMRGFSQIIKSIIIWISVAVIKIFWPLARHVKPSQMMVVIFDRIYADETVAVFSGNSRWNGYRMATTHGGLVPPKQTCLWVIAHKFAQSALRDLRLFGIHEMGRPSAHIRLAIKSPLSGQTLNGLALIPLKAA